MCSKPVPAPTPPCCQIYELRKDEIDSAVEKARGQATALYDKHLHKVRACVREGRAGVAAAWRSTHACMLRWEREGRVGV